MGIHVDLPFELAMEAVVTNKSRRAELECLREKCRALEEEIGLHAEARKAHCMMHILCVYDDLATSAEFKDLGAILQTKESITDFFFVAKLGKGFKKLATPIDRVDFTIHPEDNEPGSVLTCEVSYSCEKKRTVVSWEHFVKSDVSDVARALVTLLRELRHH